MATKPTTGRKNAGAATDILGKIAASLPSNVTPKASKPTKWEMVLTPEAEADARRWVEAKAVFEPVEKRLENAKNDFMEYAVRVMAEKLFANKTKPSNPLIILKKEDKKTADHQFQFTMTDKFKFRFPDVPEGADPRDHFVEVFTSLGLHPSDAANLVDQELDFNPITGFKTLTELMEGSYGAGREWLEATEESKAIGAKFAALLMWNGEDPTPEPLTPEEKMEVLERSPGMQVKAGFYDRVASYVQNVEQLMLVFKVIQPIAYPAYPKFAVSDPQTVKAARMITAAEDILGTVTTEE